MLPYFDAGMKAIDLVTSLIEAARAAGDDAAVAKLEAYMADSAPGKRIVARAKEAHAVIAEGRGAILAAAERAAEAKQESAEDEPPMADPLE